MPAALIGIGMVAIAGASIYGSIRNSQEAEAAANSAAAAQKKRDEAYAEATKLAKEQYERWEQDFGEIQTEVADYYKNLSDDILKQQYEDANTQANQSLVQQYFAAQYNIKSSMNKAGMAGSGAEQSSTLQLQQTALAQKAQNRWQTQQLKANANNVLMGQKANWAQQGENLRSQAMQNQYNAEAMKGNSAAADYQMYEQMRAQYTQNAINSVTNGLASMGGMMMGVGGQMYTANTLAGKLNSPSTDAVATLGVSDVNSPNYGKYTPYSSSGTTPSPYNAFGQLNTQYNFENAFANSISNSIATHKATTAATTGAYSSLERNMRGLN